VPAVDVFEHLADADLVKLDIQGSEWAILADPRLVAIPARAIVLEYHPRLAPSAAPHEDAVRLLRSAGFRTSSAVVDEHAGEGTIWAWRDPG
jgi:hypothetical protein